MRTPVAEPPVSRPCQASVDRIRRVTATLALTLAAAVPHATARDASSPTSATQATAATPAATLDRLQVFQAWRDELPDRIEAADLEVLILSPANRCSPPLQKGLFGTSVNPLNPVTGALCRRIEDFAAAPPGALPLAVRVHTGPESAATRDPAALLASIVPAPTRRYVALVHWDWAKAQRDIQWLFEIAVIDRSNGRWVWHGGRAHELWPTPEWQDKTELRALRALLVHELPRDLLTRDWWREHVPVADSRWVPLDEIAAYKPAAGRAGLVIANSYYSSNRLQDIAALKLWPVAAAEIDDTDRMRQGDWSATTTVRRAQWTPLLAPDTYALLDLPAGDYALRVYTSVERITLAEGQITVLNIQRGLGNAKTRSMETEAWWRDRLASQRSRHAFLAEPPHSGRPVVVPYFVGQTP